MTSAERIGANIKEWRARRKLTQQKLGELIDSDGPRVGKLEKGAENPTVETLDKLATALEIDIQYLTMPRPEGVTGRVDPRPAEGAAVLENLLTKLDTEAPAEDSVRGDIYKALAALTRALRRDPDSRKARDASPASRR